jgi:hypothetical protein
MSEEVMQLVEEMRKKYGDSSDFSRNSVEKAFGGIENMKKHAELWFDYNAPVGVFALFATAVDLGFRIGYVTAQQEGKGKKGGEDVRCAKLE